MRLDRMTAEIRPRSDWEAVDLGLAMVRRDFWRCFAVWWLALVVPAAAAGWWLWESPLLWLMLFWWWKPVGSRMVLFELSRRLFGERPPWRASLRQIPGCWRRRFFYRLVWARLSPWLPVTLAVEDLEGLKGTAYKQRCLQVTRRGEAAVIWIYVIADMAACWFGLAIVILVRMFIPDGQDGAWRMASESWDPNDATHIPLLILRTVVVAVMLAMSLTDVFVTGAGFGIYLNNRTWLEGWDVELAFKRLARRLTKTAMLWVALGFILLPAMTHAEEAVQAVSEPAQVIREVKADPAFKVHTVVEKVSNRQPSKNPWMLPQWLRRGMIAQVLGNVMMVTAFALLVGAILWVLWGNRLAFLRRADWKNPLARAPAVRVVMGLEISPESLPVDVPGTAWSLWRHGRHRDALGLLYRAAISRVMDAGRVEIQESDTEGDCQRRVDQAGPAVHPEYFRDLTGAWIRLAYAGHCPDDGEVEALCRQWPFVDRRDG